MHAHSSPLGSMSAMCVFSGIHLAVRTRYWWIKHYSCVWWDLIRWPNCENMKLHLPTKSTDMKYKLAVDLVSKQMICMAGSHPGLLAPGTRCNQDCSGGHSTDGGSGWAEGPLEELWCQMWWKGPQHPQGTECARWDTNTHGAWGTAIGLEAESRACVDGGLFIKSCISCQDMWIL